MLNDKGWLSVMLNFPLTKVAEKIKKKELSPVELTQEIFNKVSDETNEYHTFITVLTDTALADAKRLEEELMQGIYRGALHGIPISIKDNIAVKNVPRTNGSMIDNNHICIEDAYIVERLRQCGAIIIGKTNLDEYANHVVGKNRHYGTIRHPIKEGYSVGGSSGGSAVSVATNVSFASIGTDTSGSIRIPASSCGVVGLKPTYNLIPTVGISPVSWSLDHVGILTKNSADLAVVFAAIMNASTNFADTKKHVQINRDKMLFEMKVGVIENYFTDFIATEVEEQFNNIVEQLINMGVKVQKIKLENLGEMMNCQEIIIGFEFAAIQQRNFLQYEEHYEDFNYDFIKYGLDITFSEYRKALLEREKIKHKFAELFTLCDIIISPTLPILPPKLSENLVDWGTFKEDILIALSRYTGPFNISGLPAMSLPIGKSVNGLPIGLQLVSDFYREEQLIKTATMFEELLN